MVPDVIESLKVITQAKSRRTAEYAFGFAYLNNRKRVTAVHKANIMKLSDGLFLQVGLLIHLTVHCFCWDQLRGFHLFSINMIQMSDGRSLETCVHIIPQQA